MSERIKQALEAYRAIMMAPRPEGESGWFPPPSSQMRDKTWSKQLRWMWPEYRSVRLEDTRFSAEKSKWCKENAQYYWTAANEHVWYFSDISTALLFKLTFGGTVGVE